MEQFTQWAAKTINAGWSRWERNQTNVLGVLYQTRGGAYFIHEEVTQSVWNEAEDVPTKANSSSAQPNSKLFRYQSRATIPQSHGGNCMAKGHVVSIVPEQCRAARGWLDWSANKLAIKAGVAVSTVRDFEKGRRIPATPTLVAICQVLEREGVWFFPDGVSVKRGCAQHPFQEARQTSLTANP